MNSMMIILLTVLVQFLIGSLLGVIVVAFIVMRKHKNPVDIQIFEVCDNNIIIKDYIGRKVTTKEGIDAFVCAGMMPKSKKRMIQGKISDSDLKISSKNGRYKLMLAYKDDIYAPLKFNNDGKDTYNVTPMARQAIETAVAVKMDARETFAEKEVKLARFMLGASITLCFVAVIGVVILVAVLISVGPEFAGDIAQNLAQVQANTIVSNIPG